MKTKKEVLEYVKKHKISNIQLWFTDILGNLKCCVITDDELKSALDHGKGFDGSSVTGYAEAEESDILAMPDISTFKIVPWESRLRGCSVISLLRKENLTPVARGTP